MDEKGNEASANTSNTTSSDMDVMEFDENEITEVIDLPEEPTPEGKCKDVITKMHYICYVFCRILAQ